MIVALGSVTAMSTLAHASTSCVYNPATDSISMTIGADESARLAVQGDGAALADAGDGAIVFGAVDIGWGACGSATVTNTVTIVVLGSPAGSETMDLDAASGAEFPSSIEWRIDLGAGPSDAFRIDASEDLADSISLADTTFDLNGSGGELLGTEALSALGSDGNDTIDGSALTVSATLEGMGGNDAVRGGAAGDALLGGDGDDRLVGGAGDDRLDGGAGVDHLYGGDGADTCVLERASGPCDPSISVTPAEIGSAGSLTITGAGWYPENGDVRFSFDPSSPGSAPLTPAAPDADWAIDTTLTAPARARAYSLVACQPCSDPDAERVTEGFVVLPAPGHPTVSVMPLLVHPGDRVTVSGEDWDPSVGRVRLYTDLPRLADDDPFATVPVQADRHFEYVFSLPEIAAGTYQVWACQRCGQPSEALPSASLEVESLQVPIATLELRPAEAEPGDRIQAVGEGWDPDGGTVSVFIDASAEDTTPDARAQPDADGSFSVPLELPDLGDGRFTVLACQRCGTPRSVEDTATLTIPPRFSPWWIALGVTILAMVAGAAVAVHRIRRPPAPGHPPTVRLRPAEPQISVQVRPDGSSHHTIELVPHADPGHQELRERTPR